MLVKPSWFFVDCILVYVLMILPSVPAVAQTAAPTSRPSEGALVTSGPGAEGPIRLLVNKSVMIHTGEPYRGVNIAEPAVADVNGVSPNRLLVTGKRPGSTQLILWDERDRSQMIEIVVQSDLAPLRAEIERLFPGSKIEITVSGDTVVLNGRVPNLVDADRAVALATPYGKHVVNLLEIAGGQQVLLQVRFAEVSRSASTALGANFSFFDGSSRFISNTGQLAPIGLQQTGAGGPIDVSLPGSFPGANLFGRATMGSSVLDVFVEALRENNLLRVLAEPNLLASSGQEASFLAGGEFPVPVPQSGGGINNTTITIEYKEFGVRLNFIPVVLGDGKIRLKVSPEVSDLDFTSAVRFGGFVVPGLTSRRVSTTIELNEGQTFAIAGLLNNQVVASKDVTPLLGDIPVLGALFRSVRYQRKETELVVLVTPHIASGMNPGEVPLLPGENWRHPTEAELFLNQDLGNSARDGAGRTRLGRYGMVPHEEPRHHNEHEMHEE